MEIANSDNRELEAVNDVLASIGESPVNTLEDAVDIDVINARRIVQEVNRRVQTRVWSFNYIEGYTLNPDATDNNRIKWNSNFMYLEGLDGVKLVRRGAYVYNLTDQTYVFTQSITVDVCMALTLEELPDPAYRYVVAVASQKYALRFLGDEALSSHLGTEVQEAYMYLMEYEMDNNDYNMLDNTDVQGVKG